MTKVTITLSPDDLLRVRDLVRKGQAQSISGFVQHAVGLALRDAEGWGPLLESDLEQTGGPLTPAERAWADEILGGAAAPRKRSRAA